VADGAYFLVAGSGNVAAYVYRRVSSSVSTPITDYPSKAAYDSIRSVGKNIFDKDQTFLANSIINTTTGLPSTNLAFTTEVSGFIPVTAAATYVNNAPANIKIAQYDATKTYVGVYNLVYTASAPLTLGATTHFIRIEGGGLSGNTTLQIEDGAIKTVYEPYKELIRASIVDTDSVIASIKSKSAFAEPDVYKKVGKNLFDSSQAFTANATINNTSGMVATSPAWTTSASGFIPVTPSTQYVNNDAFNWTVYEYGQDKQYLSLYGSINKSAPRAIGAATHFIRVVLEPSKISGGQIEVGAVSTGYESYYKLVDNENLNLSAIISDSEDQGLLDAYLQESVGKNLFEISGPSVASSVWGSGGQVSTNAAFAGSTVYTDYMPVAPSTAYIANTVYTAKIAWYNADKVYISQGSTYSTLSITSPSNAAYARLGTTSAVETDKIQFERGTTPTIYEPYTLAYRGNLDKGKINQALQWADNTLALPSKIYMLAGNQNNIYYQAIQRRTVRDVFFTRINGTGFGNNERKAWATPAAAGDVALTATLYDGEFDPVATKTTTAVVKSPSTPSTAFSMLAIGDSMTFEGHWLNRIQSLIPAITTLGIRAGASQPSVFHEARSGWSLKNLFELYGAHANYGFTPFMHPVGAYRYMGTTKTWKQVAAAPTHADVVGMTAIYATLGIDANGRPTKDPGSSTLAANAVIYDDATSVFQVWDGSAWNTITGLTWEFNFTKYLSTFGVATPNAVAIMSGYNDFSGNTVPREVSFKLFPAWKARVDTMIASAQAAGVGKVAILIPLSVTGSLNTDTGARFTRRMDATLWEVRSLIIQNYDNRTGEGIYLVDAGSSVDPDYGFTVITPDWPGDAEKPFAEYTGSAVILTHNNDPHPNAEGYYQLAARVAGWIQSVR
jgi:hypothetical protein